MQKEYSNLKVCKTKANTFVKLFKQHSFELFSQLIIEIGKSHLVDSMFPGN